MTQIALDKTGKKTTNNTPPIDQLTNAAWQFAYAALWQEQAFFPKEIERVKKEIGDYFLLSSDIQKAFIALCERVVLTNRYLASEKSRYLPHPSIWFNKNYQFGYAGTLSWYHRVQTKRLEIPNYNEGIKTLAQYYWQYTRTPSNKIVTACRKKLHLLNEYGLVQIFYYAVIYSQILNP